MFSGAPPAHISHRDINASQRAAALDNPVGMRDHLGNMGYGLMTGLGLFSGMTSGPFNAAISGAHQLSDMQNVAGMRNPGLRDSPSHGQQPGYDASIGTDNSGDMLAQTPQTTSPTEPRILQELGIAGPGIEGVGTLIGGRPPDGGMTTDDLARVSEGSPVKNALKLAYKRDMDEIKSNIIAQALQRQRGAA